MELETEEMSSRTRNRSFEFFSKEAELRGLALVDSEEYKKLKTRKEQLEKAAEQFRNLT